MKTKIFFSVLLSSIILISQTVKVNGQVITTIAGCGIGNDSLATRAELFQPMSIASDNFGNIYIADDISYTVRKVDTAGVITLFAGNEFFGYSGDGAPATLAEISEPTGVTVDKNGDIFFADAENNRVRKVNRSGIITTVAGTGTAGYNFDGIAATAAQLNYPCDVTVDTLGNIYIADEDNNRVREINSSTGIITTVAGNGVVGFSGMGGPATSATIYPFRVALDNRGNLFIADVGADHILKVDTAGIITNIAGTGAYSYSGDGGPATLASMTAPSGLATDATGNVYFSDLDNERVRMINMTTGVITSFVANGTAGYSGDGGISTSAEISSPEGLVFDLNGNLYISDYDNNRIRKVNPGGIITTFAGQNGLFGDGYAAINAEITYPTNLATDMSGNIYIADYYNNRIRMINAITGILITVAGSGIAGYEDGFSGDGGPANLANIYNPFAVAIDLAGNLYICDAGNQRIRKVNTSGIISTIAGTGIGSYGGDGGPATMAQLNTPSGITVDRTGNIYVCDAYNQRIRKINTSGIITTVAGNGVIGEIGDGGPATLAELNIPSDVCIDGMDNLYICDGLNNRIRKVDTAGIITTVAGNGIAGYSGDNGPALSAEINGPNGIKSDSMGNLFFTDEINQRVRMVTSDGIITTLAGNGTVGFGGDGGPATDAMLNSPLGVAIDKMGNLFIGDGINSRVRKVNLGLLAVPIVNKTNQLEIDVYPNPTKGIINIIGAPNNCVVLYDIAGKELFEKSIISANETIDLNNFASGVYIIQTTNNIGVRNTVKVIKE